MRVLIVNDGLANGGAERQLALLASSLPKDHVVQVLALQDGPYREVLEDLGIAVKVLPRSHRYDVIPAFKMWSHARSFRPDVVHAWSWMSAAGMRPWCWATGVPLLDCVRRGSPPTARKFVVGRSIALSDGVVANSHAGLRANRVPDRKGRVVYNAFDMTRLSGLEGVPAATGDGRTTVVMAARMAPVKDWRAFLRAARALSTIEPGGWRFVALGSGRDRVALMADAADLIADGIVEFPPTGIEVLPVIASADIGVLLTDPVTAEGCSNALMEYMACGLPVVCTDSGGNPELVTDGESGYLVKAGDDDALIDALGRLRGDRSTARAMGEVGRKRILDDFSIEAMVTGFVSAYGWATGTEAAPDETEEASDWGDDSARGPTYPRQALRLGAAYSGIPWLLRETVNRDRPTVLCLHDPTPDRMRALLGPLESRFNFIPLVDVVDWIEGREAPLPPKALAITLDDGWAGNAKLETVFREFGVTPTVFVSTGIVGTSRRFWVQAVPSKKERDALKHMPDAVRLEELRARGFNETDAFDGPPATLTLDEVKDMARWADVQSHTRLHPILPMCDDDRAWLEIAGSRSDLIDELGGEVYALAYPNGDFGPREIDMARRAGYRCAFGVQARPVASSDDPYGLPRVVVANSATKETVLVSLSGAHRTVRALLQRAG